MAILSHLAKTNYIELGDGEQIPILYEDRSVMAIDKPPGWMLVPVSWQKTDRNLQAAILSSIAAKDFWARSRNLKFLQNVHRLDAETTGILLMVKSQGALRPFTSLFESRRMEKTYLVVVEGVPTKSEWISKQPISPDPRQIGRMVIDSKLGKPAETHFTLLETVDRISLLKVHPITGRTHQIRVHSAGAGLPVVGDTVYGTAPFVRHAPPPLGLRSIELEYENPFDGRRVQIKAPTAEFLSRFGFKAGLA